MFVLGIWNLKFEIVYVTKIIKNNVNAFHPLILFYIFNFFYNRNYLCVYNIILSYVIWSINISFYFFNSFYTIALPENWTHFNFNLLLYFVLIVYVNLWLRIINMWTNCFVFIETTSCTSLKLLFIYHKRLYYYLKYFYFENIIKPCKCFSCFYFTSKWRKSMLKKSTRMFNPYTEHKKKKKH